MLNRLSGFAIITLLFLAVSVLPAVAQTTDGAPPAETAGLQAAAAPSQKAAAPAAGQPAPVPAPDVLTRGINDFNLGNYEEAFDELTKAREQSPQSATAAYYLGATLKKMEQYQNAIPHLMAAVTLQPPAKEAYLELADAYYVTDQMDPALRALDLAKQANVDPGRTAYLRGQVLAKKRRYADALASFDQAKAKDPKLAPACDYQVALIYARTGKQTEARDLFQAIAQKDPDSDEGGMARQQAEALTARLKERKPFTAIASLQYQYDSNVVLTDHTEMVTNVSGKSDTAAVVALKAEYAPEMQLPYGTRFQYFGYMNSHTKLHAYDMQSHTIAVVPSYRVNENLASLPITYNYTLLDNEKYLQAYALTPTYSFALANNQNAQVSVLLQKKDYLQTPLLAAENQDATDLGLGLAWYRAISDQKGYLSLRYDLTREDAVGNNWSNLSNKLAGGMLAPVTDRIKAVLAADVERFDFSNANSSFDIKRVDTTYSASLQARYELTRIIEGQLEYAWTQNDSNIPVYAYHKNVVTIGINARF